MDLSDIKTTIIALETLADQGRLHELMSELRNKTSWSASGLDDKLASVEYTYSSLLEFYKNSSTDPQRNLIYSKVLTDLYNIIYQWADIEAIKTDSIHIRYRNQKNLLPTEATMYIASYFKSKSLFDQMPQPATLPVEMELTMRHLFDIVWSFMPNSELCNTIADFINNTEARTEDRTLILGAIILAASQRFIPQYIAMLFSLSDAQNNTIRSKAIAGAMLCVVKHADRIKNENQLWAQWTSMMNSMPHKRDLTIALMAILKTVQTSDITEKMLTDVTPTILSVKNNKGLHSLHEIDWDEMTGEDKHLKKSLNKLMKWQMEGADVFLSTFSHLKDYKFFIEISSWLMPFDECNAALVKALEAIPIIYRKSFLEGVRLAPVLCESDKYSILMSFSFIPTTSRESICEMYTRELEAVTEANDNNDLSFGSHQCIADQYIRDLYRLFYVYPRRKEFVNPFEALSQFLSSDLFHISFLPTEREILADYMGHQSQYTIAKNIYLGVKPEQETAQYIKKLIFCYMAEDNCQQALTLLQKLECISGQTTWSLKMRARCYRFLQLTDNEAQCLSELIALDTTNIELKQQLSDCYARANLYAKALQLMYEIDYLQPTATTAYKVANYMLIVGKGADAIRYISRTDATNPQHLTIAAYVYLCAHNTTAAIEALEKTENHASIDACADYARYRLSFDANNISLHDLKFLTDIVAK